jgi:hypothetical protein
VRAACTAAHAASRGGEASACWHKFEHKCKKCHPLAFLPTQHAVGMHRLEKGCHRVQPSPGARQRRREAADLSASTPCAWSSLATRKFLVPSKQRAWARHHVRGSPLPWQPDSAYTREGFTSVLEGRKEGGVFVPPNTPKGPRKSSQVKLFAQISAHRSPSSSSSSC